MYFRQFLPVDELINLIYTRNSSLIISEVFIDLETNANIGYFKTALDAIIFSKIDKITFFRD